MPVASWELFFNTIRSYVCTESSTALYDIKDEARECLNVEIRRRSCRQCACSNGNIGPARAPVVVNNIGCPPKLRWAEEGDEMEPCF